MSTAAGVSWKGAWHSHILVCAGFCPHLISYSKDVELDTAILVNIYEQQDMWASSHALGCCKCHVHETAASDLKPFIFLFICRPGWSL